MLTGVPGPEMAIDPAAGKFRQPTPAEAQAFVRSLVPFFASPNERLVAQEGADGMVSVDLSGQFLTMAIATTQADGSLSSACVTNLAEAFAALADPPALEEK
jgi:hypothetical protein